MKAKSWFTIRAMSGDPSTAEVDIHDEIGAWGVTAKDFMAQLRGLGPVQNIKLSLHSPGGDVFDGIAIYNALKSNPARVTGQIQGIAASMASVIAMACDELVMPRNAFLMIHNPSGMVWGESSDMKEMADLLDKLRGSLVKAYADKTGLPDDDIIKMMDEETWLDGEEATEMGFCDAVLDEVKLAAIADFDTRRFAKMPTALSDPPAEPAAPAPAAQPAEPTPTADPAPAPAPEPAPAPTAKKAGILERIASAFSGDETIRAELTQAKADRDAHAATITALKSEIDQLKAELAEFTELKAKLVELETKQATASAQAAAIVAATGFTPEQEAQLPPPAASAESGDAAILQKFESLSGAERTAYYQQHKAEINRANEARAKAGKAPPLTRRAA